MANNRSQSGCCGCCFSFILTSGLTALFLWLSLRTSNPTCSIQDFYVPALNNTNNTRSTNTSIYFDLKLHNKNKDKGVYYDTLNITFYYVTNRTLPVGNYTVMSFYQGHKKSTRRKTLVETYGVPWEEVSNGSNPVFRVVLATAVRFKIVGIKTKRHKLVVGTNVELKDSGQVKKKGIKLKSGAPERKCYCARLVALLLVFTNSLVLLSVI